MPIDPKNLDLNAVALARAIRFNESGGDFNARGRSGESGGYQFMPATWKAWAGKYLGDSNASLTPENQNRVAYGRIKELKDAGYKPSQILSMWNSGSPDFEGKKGTNKMGVAYDVPLYVQKGLDRFQKEVVALGGKLPQAAASTGLMAGGGGVGQIQEQQVQQENKGSFLGNLARGIVNPFIKAGYTVAQGIGGIVNLGQAAYDKATGDEAGYQRNVQEGLMATDPNRKLNLPFFGEIGRINSTREAIGTGLEIGTTVIGGGSGGALREAGKAGVKGLVKEGIVQGAKFGAASGAAQGIGAGLENPEASAGQVALGGAAGGLLGAATGGALGGAFAGTSAMLRSAFGGSKTVQSLASSAERDGMTSSNFFSRSARRIEDTFKQRAESKAQPAVVRTAAKSGVPEEVGSFIHGSSPADKVAYRQMLDLAEDSTKTLRPNKRPVEVVGNSVIARVRGITEDAQATGKRLYSVMLQMPKKPISIAQTHTDFVTELGRLGVRVERGGKLNFDNSAIGDITGSQDRKMLQAIYNLINPKNAAGHTPATLERLRQRLFADLKLGKANQVLTEQVDVLINTLRKNLRQDISEGTGTLGKLYLKETQRYAVAEDTLSKFYSLIGRKWSGKFEDLAELRTGEVMNRALGNASADPLRVVSLLDETSRTFGLKFNDDPIQQLIFNDILEELVGSTQSRGLAGQVAKGVRSASEDAANIGVEAAAGNTTVIGAGRQLLKFVSKITPEEQIRALRMLLQ